MRKGFTLAEVLITLGIIGVVAALVLPALIKDIKYKDYATARKRALSIIGEGVRIITINGSISDSADAQDFVENQLKKQIKMLKTCDNDNLRKCGIETDANKIKSMSETPMTMPVKLHELAAGMASGVTTKTNTPSYGFVMANGYSVNLFYNPNCMQDDPEANHYGQDRVCVNAIYDMNGLAKPNQIGQDIGFVTVLYPDQTSIAYAPDVVRTNAAISGFDEAAQACTNQNPDYSLPNRDELLSMYMNSNLLGIAITALPYWSASEASPELGWYQHFGGPRVRSPKATLNNVRCIRK
ncbi:MAG: prepilin-type N-terminal cleavage/methylation domain-containing protein [Heliobacteriaceae bacterium]|jgi:prepilin-type N-terminal cleavage/methylation domain-containing protein|nr:prepilin-type N-terminal cleavage/methylation domain-containing protein [Heliobacteriaceae bacterium]